MKEPGGGPSSASISRWCCYLLLFLLALAFGLAYSQSPLFTSNQNQYFLHGLARSGLGNLQDDWLANTIDPTPVFSYFVFLTHTLFRFDGVYYLVYLVLLAVYFLSCLGIARETAGIDHPLAGLLFVLFFTVLHSSAFRYFLSQFTAPDWAYLFEGGLAGQRVLGTVLQPSSFGLLYFLSIYLFLRTRWVYSAIAAVLPAVIHPTYLLPSALFILAYMWGVYQEGKKAGPAAKTGFISMVLALPVVSYVLIAFRPSTQEEYSRAQEILVNFRLPHHALILDWLDGSSIFQLALVVLAAYLTRKGRLYPLFITCIGAGLFLSILQFLTGSRTLALLFPWRISSILVPLSTTILLALLTEALFNRSKTWFIARDRLLFAFGGLVILMTVGAGISYFIQESKEREFSAENELFVYVEQNKQAGDVYLTPIDMQDFRLETGAAAYVDFKSIPYNDLEVLEWHSRVVPASDFYRKRRIDCQELKEWTKADGITHLVLTQDQREQDCAFLDEIFTNRSYRLFRIENDR